MRPAAICILALLACSAAFAHDWCFFPVVPSIIISGGYGSPVYAYGPQYPGFYPTGPYYYNPYVLPPVAQHLRPTPALDPNYNVGRSGTVWRYEVREEGPRATDPGYQKPHRILSIRRRTSQESQHLGVAEAELQKQAPDAQASPQQGVFHRLGYSGGEFHQD